VVGIVSEMAHSSNPIPAFHIDAVAVSHE